MLVSKCFLLEKIVYTSVHFLTLTQSLRDIEVGELAQAVGPLYLLKSELDRLSKTLTKKLCHRLVLGNQRNSSIVLLDDVVSALSSWQRPRFEARCA